MHVTVLPNGHEEGFIDGSFYNTGNPPPITDPNTRHITFEDGTVMEYIEGSSTFNIKTKGPVNITTTGNVTLNANGTVTLQAGTTFTIKGATILLDAPNVKVTGILWVDQLKPYQAGEIMSNPHVKNFDGSGNGS